MKENDVYANHPNERRAPDTARSCAGVGGGHVEGFREAWGGLTKLEGLCVVVVKELGGGNGLARWR